MTLTLLHSKMFDVGDLPVLTFGDCVLKTGVIKRPLKLFVRFFNVFFSKSKKLRLFTLFLSCCIRFLECWMWPIAICVHHGLSVSVDGSHVSCKNGRTDRDAVGGVYAGVCIKWGPDTPGKTAILGDRDVSRP